MEILAGVDVFFSRATTSARWVGAAFAADGAALTAELALATASACPASQRPARPRSAFVKLRMRGNIDYVIATLCPLIAVFKKQSPSDLPGAQTAAWVAIRLGVVLALETVALRRRL